MKNDRFTGKDADSWLLKYAKKWGVPINFREVTPDYYTKAKEVYNERQQKER